MMLCGLFAAALLFLLLHLDLAAAVRDDRLHEARCSVRCAQNKTCFAECLNSKMSKLGQCPDTSSLSPFDLACLNACVSDTDCPEIDKCCTHSCGITCQRPKGLKSITDLPEIPTNLTIRERRRGKTLLVEWSSPGNYRNEQYVIQERHHLGRHFSASRLGSWHFIHRTSKPKYVPKKLLRPGRWYVFRVAAVNENGTKGYSDPSRPFTLPNGPKAPGPPENLSVVEHVGKNNTIFGVLSWKPPQSDLPIQRYKIFWSRRLQDSPPSVLVKHQTISPALTKFVLKHLEPNSLYFLQVQALAQFGSYKLKGDKAAIFLNTKGGISQSVTKPKLS